VLSKLSRDPTTGLPRDPRTAFQVRKIRPSSHLKRFLWTKSEILRNPEIPIIQSEERFGTGSVASPEALNRCLLASKCILQPRELTMLWEALGGQRRPVLDIPLPPLASRIYTRTV
jgi:hypothetical protein